MRHRWNYAHQHKLDGRVQLREGQRCRTEWEYYAPPVYKWWTDHRHQCPLSLSLVSMTNQYDSSRHGRGDGAAISISNSPTPRKYIYIYINNNKKKGNVGLGVDRAATSLYPLVGRSTFADDETDFVIWTFEYTVGCRRFPLRQLHWVKR